MEKIKDFDFELNLEFEGNKNPSEAFIQLAKLYEKLIDFDKHIAYNISVDSKVEYDLVDIEFGSIKTKIKQIFINIPDDVLKDVLNPSAWFGHLLVYVKHRLLKSIENNELTSKKDLDKITELCFDGGNTFFARECSRVTLESHFRKSNTELFSVKIFA